MFPSNNGQVQGGGGGIVHGMYVEDFANDEGG
jgi:hypothetical protein